MGLTISHRSGLENGSLDVAGQITYDDVGSYMDNTRYLDLSSSRRVEHADLAFARGRYWMEPIRPSVHLTGCDLVYLNDEHVSGCYKPSLFVGLLTEGEHTGYVGSRSIATSRIGVPTLIGVGREVEMRSGQRAGQVCRMSGFHVGADFLEMLAQDEFPGSGGLARLLGDGFFMREVDDNVALTILLTQLADNPFTGAMAQIFAESRILSALVELRGVVAQQPDRGVPHLSHRHRDHAEHARLLLDARLTLLMPVNHEADSPSA